MEGEAQTFGCVECGQLVDALPPEHACGSCGGVVIALGGDPTASKAQALIAWARKDATEVIRGHGTTLGVALGVIVSIAAVWLMGVRGPVALAAVPYGALLGGLLGHYFALRVYQRLRPESQLQPIVIERQEKRARLGIYTTIIGAVIVLGLAASYGDGDPAEGIRRAAGMVWLLLVR